jgi:hypothetical protein
MDKSRFSDPEYSTKWTGEVTVKTITLDTLIKRYGMPGLIKIDIEGYEYIAIRGLTSKAKTICFEWTEELFNNCINTVDYIKSLGYSEFAYTLANANEIPATYNTWDIVEKQLSDMIIKDRKELFGMLFCR